MGESSNCSMKMSVASDGGTQQHVLPPYKEYLQDEIGGAFEKVLEDYCCDCYSACSSATTLRDIGSNPQSRAILVQRALKEFQTWSQYRLWPLMKTFSAHSSSRVTKKKFQI